MLPAGKAGSDSDQESVIVVRHRPGAGPICKLP
jgi:hypothetical protein